MERNLNSGDAVDYIVDRWQSLPAMPWWSLLSVMIAAVFAIAMAFAQSRIAFVSLALLMLGLLLSGSLLLARIWRLREKTLRWQVGEQRRLEQLVCERTAELSDLTSHMHSVGEREKADLARELHDELGSILTVARIDLDWLRQHNGGSQTEARLQSLAHSIGDAMEVKHRVVESLRPQLLDHFGLPVALKSHFEDTCRKAGLTCNAQVPDECAGISSDVAIALFRVAQESLTNIIRHAHASRVELRFESDQSDYRIGIVDDGIGFAQARSAKSHGLVGMRHRIDTLGGQFRIEANQPRGTRVEVAVPHSCCG